MRSAPREALEPGQGVSCWAKHRTDPAPDRHTALRRFPPLVWGASFSEVPKHRALSVKTPHAKSQLPMACAKNAQIGARAC
eukprot:8495753-Pyramimonas_sp.AAC.1